MKTKKFLFYILVVILGGCIPIMSVHPLYTKSDIIFDQKILGTWIDDPNSPQTTWEFSRMDEPNNSYKLIFTDSKGRKGFFKAYLVKLEGKLFLDAFPGETPWELEDPNKVDWPYNSFFFLPSHTFLKIDSIEPRMKLRVTANSQMEDFLKEHPDSIEHIIVEDRIVLTASTKELQSFILKYADDEKLFPSDITLVRK